MSRSLFSWSEVFFAKLFLNLKSETKKTYLGYAWWIIEPMMYVAVLYMVFGVFLHRGTSNFIVFLLCGKIPFLWFSKSVANASNSIFSGRGLINQIAIPKAFFATIVVAQDFVKQSVVFACLLVFLLAYGLQPSIEWLGVLPVVLAQLLLVLAVALFTSAVVPFVPDFKFIVNTGLMLLMFGSGVFYSYKEVLLEQHQALFLLNPVASLIKNYRQVIMDNSWPDWLALGYIGIGSAIFIALMLAFFNKNDSLYARLVIQ